MEAGETPLTVHSWPGGHDGTYWQAHYRAYLHFYATALSGHLRGASCPAS